MDNSKQKIKVDERLQHIAFIMDGNGRWAKKRGLPRTAGHVTGADAFERVANYCGQIGIKYITGYAFSTENWKRSENEINAIMKLFGAYLDKCMKTIGKYNMSLHIIGDTSVLSKELKDKIKKAEEMTANGAVTLNIAVNYGGRDEIVHAVNSLLAQGKTNITEADISKELYTKNCPEPDIIVRTAGEQRISNFLMWQSAYSEFYFTPTLWPDMNEDTVDEIVREFYQRHRNFGAIPENNS